MKLLKDAKDGKVVPAVVDTGFTTVQKGNFVEYLDQMTRSSRRSSIQWGGSPGAAWASRAAARVVSARVRPRSRRQLRAGRMPACSHGPYGSLRCCVGAPHVRERGAMPYVRYTRACLEAAARWPPVGRPWSGALRPRVRSIPVFEPRIVDRFLARAHPITPALWFGPFIVAAVYRAVVSGEVLLSGHFVRLAGVVAARVLFHRFGFHFEARTPEERLAWVLGARLPPRVSRRPIRLVAPPLMSWPIGLVSRLSSCDSDRQTGSPTFAGMSAGYIAYDWIHYYTHHFRPQVEGSESGYAATTCCTTSRIVGRASE